jgi:hypothetical protein
MSLERWIDEEDRLEEAAPGDADVELRELMVAARRGRAPMPEDEAGDVLARLMDEARRRRRKTWGAPAARWFVGLAAALALAAGLNGTSSRHRARDTRALAPHPVVVKEVFFESVRDGKVARLEVTLYRIDTKEEKADVSTPPL